MTRQTPIFQLNPGGFPSLAVAFWSASRRILCMYLGQQLNFVVFTLFFSGFGWKICFFWGGLVWFGCHQRNHETAGWLRLGRGFLGDMAMTWLDLGGWRVVSAQKIEDKQGPGIYIYHMYLYIYITLYNMESLKMVVRMQRMTTWGTNSEHLAKDAGPVDGQTSYITWGMLESL